MSTETRTTQLQTSAGYRSTRTFATVACAISFAWSTAQFDLKSITIGFLGTLDLSGTSIALVSFVLIAYLFAQSAIEFSMQSVEVRQWRPAQLDFVLLLYLVRISVAMLGVSGLSRSLKAVAYTAAAGVGILVSFMALIFLGLILYMLLMNFGGRKKTIASIVLAGIAWGELIAIFTISAVIIGLGFAAGYSEFVRSFFPAPPDPAAMIFMACMAVLVVWSFTLATSLAAKLFAVPPTFTEIEIGGTLRRVYEISNASPVWDWSSDAGTKSQRAQVRKVKNRRCRK